jgi:hypothetical protein
MRAAWLSGLFIASSTLSSVKEVQEAGGAQPHDAKAVVAAEDRPKPWMAWCIEPLAEGASGLGHSPVQTLKLN